MMIADQLSSAQLTRDAAPGGARDAQMLLGDGSVLRVDAHDLADRGHGDVDDREPGLRRPYCRWREGARRETSVLTALQGKNPWAVRRLHEAARRTPRVFAVLPLPRPVELTPGAAPRDDELTPEEATAIDMLVDLVIDDWIMEKNRHMLP